ncbi:outer membrane lipoprotein chaperone LolA [Comamonas flocculans]|uniref:Outer-membrane lipoprotein carrier protein n=1 Tax=Comamonas flocculans TaxID=2597701 RepID=A0A5B8RRK9_9BURK|nr:outer membrane lipoprotein chaperone LolA [Comamonas flocculans]QEA11653.1 outer membrane lipoprotein chaperone LolA [Comamonas flocculans]
MQRLFFTILIAACAGGAWAQGLKSLESFMQQARSGEAEFTQQVTAPARDGKTAPPKVSSGHFAFERPGRFRFDYAKPFVQTIVADGKTLWLYDADLNQVTERAQDQALGSTPAALLTSKPDLAELGKDFTLTEQPDADGLHWVLASPKAQDGQIASVRVGLKGEVLARLVIVDHFGLRSELRFSDFKLNAPLPAGSFRFTPPKGADVLRE